MNCRIYSKGEEVEKINKLKIRIRILEEIDSEKIISEEELGVSEKEFDDAVNYLKREGYIGGFNYADNRPLLFEGTAYLTEKGEKYLNEKSNL